MKILLFIFIVLFVIIFMKYVLYRRQIRDICRQLEFLQTHTTNKRIQLSQTAPEIRMLAAYLNRIYDEQAVYTLNLQRKDRRMKEMLVNVSHDIRTPLTALKGYLQLLISEEQPEKQHMYADVMQQKLGDLTVLLDELFTFTRLQNEDYTLEMKRQNLTTLVLEVLFSFHESFKAEGIEPQINMTETPVYVSCNETAVKRIFSNILRNAQLHGSGFLSVRYEADGEMAVFVCENMISEPEKVDITQVFDRFYKADEARSRQSSGLGLSIAKGFVEKMNGQITAELQGNLFRICVCLPVCSL